MLQIYKENKKVYEYQMPYHFALSYPLLSLNTDVKLVNKDGEILGADEILTLRTNRKLNDLVLPSDLKESLAGSPGGQFNRYSDSYYCVLSHVLTSFKFDP